MIPGKTGQYQALSVSIMSRNSVKIEAAADVVIFGIEDNKLTVLLVKRRNDPFKGMWALPGGFIGRNEDVVDAAKRELKEETGVSGIYLEQLYTFGEPKRDPRGRVLSVAYFALLSVKRGVKAGDDARDANFFPVSSLPPPAFDHKKIISYAVTRLRNKIQYTNAVSSMLPEEFSLGEIQKIYEIIWNKKVDKRNFRKKILSLGLLMPLPVKRRGLRSRPAKLYKFKTKKYVELRRFF